MEKAAWVQSNKWLDKKYLQKIMPPGGCGFRWPLFRPSMKEVVTQEPLGDSSL